MTMGKRRHHAYVFVAKGPFLPLAQFNDERNAMYKNLNATVLGVSDVRAN